MMSARSAILGAVLGFAGFPLATAEAERTRPAVELGGAVTAQAFNQFTVASPAFDVRLAWPIRPRRWIAIGSFSSAFADLGSASRLSMTLTAGVRARVFDAVGLYVQIGAGGVATRESLELDLADREVEGNEHALSAVGELAIGWLIAERAVFSLTVRPHLASTLSSRYLADVSVGLGVRL